MQEMGHSIAGDKKYGATGNPIGRLGLHASVLAFIHPVTGKELRFESESPGEVPKTPPGLERPEVIVIPYLLPQILVDPHQPLVVPPLPFGKHLVCRFLICVSGTLSPACIEVHSPCLKIHGSADGCSLKACSADLILHLQPREPALPPLPTGLRYEEHSQ